MNSRLSLYLSLSSPACEKWEDKECDFLRISLAGLLQLIANWLWDGFSLRRLLVIKAYLIFREEWRNAFWLRVIERPIKFLEERWIGGQLNLYMDKSKINRMQQQVERIELRFSHCSADASSSNEAVHLQQRLKSLSSELVTLRNRLHVSQRPTDVTPIDVSTEPTAGCKVAIANLITSASNRLASNGQFTSANVQLMAGSQPKSTTDSNNKLNSKVCTAFISTNFRFKNIISCWRKYCICEDRSLLKIISDFGDRRSQIAWRKRWTHCRSFRPEIRLYLIHYPSMLQSKQMVRKVRLEENEKRKSRELWKSFSEIHVNGGTLPRRAPTDVDTTNKPKIFSPTRTVTGTHKVQSKDMEDLIHLQGPLTEDAVMRTLQARFNDGKYFVSFDFFFLSFVKFAIRSSPLNEEETQS